MKKLEHKGFVLVKATQEGPRVQVLSQSCFQRPLDARNWKLSHPSSLIKKTLKDRGL